MPQNYNGVTNNDFDFNSIESATVSGYPSLSVTSDFFNTWLAQNSQVISLNNQQQSIDYQINSATDFANGISNILSKASNLDIAALSEGASLGVNLAKSDINYDFYVKQQMAQVERQKLVPDNTVFGSSNATLLGYSALHLQCLIDYTIKRQFAEKIDKFFSAYGYQTNIFKSPNISNRPNWNYVKCQGINIEAYIPQNDLQTIKNLFNNGITLWHNPNTFLDYSQNNH